MDLTSRILDLILMAPAFVFAISFHEAAHAWVAYRLGDTTQRLRGRLTLNPAAHLDPLGTLMFFFSALAGMGFGWGKPVMHTIYNRRDRLYVAAVGPLTNLIQAAAWALLFHTYRLPWFVGIQNEALANLLLFGVVLNSALFVFNLVPIPPLDGSHVLAGLLPERQAEAFERMERYGFVILMLLLFMVPGVFSAFFVPLVNRVISVFL